ncbi:hypothetical protein CLOM_g11426 [Closterium sp. NIES-68]|nr:hypothetical protein CLOM_g11426 [Closterium sp. NIES-68]GJP72950.1 hypothetical protein CLOP_g3718 [Closterium sp. NIES-67]
MGAGAQNQSAAAGAAGLASTPVSVVLSVFVIIFIFLFFFVMLFRACLMVLNGRDAPNHHAITPEEYMLRRTQLSAMQKTQSLGLDPETVQALPTVTFSREKLREGCCESFRECAVCLGEYEEGECIKTLPSCGHRFHATCIDVWFCAHTTCPICRFNLKPAKPANKEADSSGGATDSGASGTAGDEVEPSATIPDASATASATMSDDVSIQVEIVETPVMDQENAPAAAPTPAPPASAAAAAVSAAPSAAAAVAASVVSAAGVVAQRGRTAEEDRRQLRREGGQEGAREISETWAEIELTGEENGTTMCVGESRRLEELRRFLGLVDEEDSGLREQEELRLKGGEGSGEHDVCVRIEC